MMLTVKVSRGRGGRQEAGVTLYVANPLRGDFSKKISALAKQIIENKAAA